MDSAGDFVIAYQGYDSNSHGVFAQRFNSSGAAQGSIFRVNTPQNDNQGAPSIAMDSAGNFVIAWLDGGTTQTAGVYAQRYNSVRRGAREQYRNQHGRRREQPFGRHGADRSVRHRLAIHADRVPIRASRPSGSMPAGMR